MKRTSNPDAVQIALESAEIERRRDEVDRLYAEADRFLGQAERRIDRAAIAADALLAGARMEAARIRLEATGEVVPPPGGVIDLRTPLRPSKAFDSVRTIALDEIINDGVRTAVANYRSA